MKYISSSYELMNFLYSFENEVGAKELIKANNGLVPFQTANENNITINYRVNRYELMHITRYMMFYKNKPKDIKFISKINHSNTEKKDQLYTMMNSLTDDSSKNVEFSDFNLVDSLYLLLIKHKNSKSKLLNLYNESEKLLYTPNLKVNDYFLLSFEIAQLLTKKHDDLVNSDAIYNKLLNDDRLTDNLLLKSAIYNGNSLNIIRRNKVALAMKLQKESLNLADVEIDKVRSIINYLRLKGRYKDEEFSYYLGILLDINEQSKEIQVKNHINNFLYRDSFREGKYKDAKLYLNSIQPLNYLDQRKLFNNYSRISKFIRFENYDINHIIDITQINQFSDLLKNFFEKNNDEDRKALIQKFNRFKDGKKLVYE